MQPRASGFFARAAGLGVVFTAGVMLAIPARGNGQQPPAGLPVIPIAPLASAQGPDAKQPEKKAAGKEDGKNGNKQNGEWPKANHPEAGPELSLGECIAVAFERSPALRAYMKTQEATAASSRALNNIGTIGSVIAPDLPFRKQQAARGLVAAAAEVQKKRNEIVQDVTRLYYTVVYARQQESIALDVVAQLEALVQVAEQLLKLPRPGNVTAVGVNAMKVGLAQARELRLKAQTGGLRAMAGLRQLMAVTEAEFPFRVKDTELPVIAAKAPLTKDVVVDLALATRPEMSLAAAGVDAYRLEVYAQASVSCRQTVRTFASGSDIHARQVPQGSRDETYRPEAIGPEMPPQLVGSKIDRVARARFYCERAEYVYEYTRSLVALEAEIALLAVEQTAANVGFGKDRFREGENIHAWVRNNIDNNQIQRELLVTQYVVASKAQSDYVEAVFQHLLALAALERVTAGAIKPPFPGR